MYIKCMEPTGMHVYKLVLHATHSRSTIVRPSPDLDFFSSMVSVFMLAEMGSETGVETDM